jgi:RNA-directed DNA polymerase
MPNTEQLATVGWEQTDWRKLERIVFKLQKRIYQASQRGDVKAVRKLQKTLMKSWSARMLAVRRVTQDNRGKKTAGVDGVKSLTPKQRLTLVDRLRRVNNRKAKPVRRVWIDKPGKTEKRPLGIPTMDDRAAQALAKAALEPEWEAKFEPNSYGFRPGRSCHDAIEAIFQAICQKPKYVLDADIAKCFDRINHEALLNKLNTFPTMRRLIKSWLKAGVVDWSAYANRHKSHSSTSEGTPQGGVISPLLANIALHGLENRLKQFAGTLRIGVAGKRDNMKQLTVVRYADDFVILHPDKAAVQRCQQITAEWLKDMGLELKPEKTRLSHTLSFTEEGNVGFNFLGFTIRQHIVGKYASKQGFKTIITPSKETVKSHTQKVGTIIQRHKTAPKEALITKLNPVIRGWCNYQRGQCSKEVFAKCDHITYQQLRGWAVSRHKGKQRRTRTRREWKCSGKRNWIFATNDGKFSLINHSDTKVVRHIKVEGVRSPYDGDWIYWSARKGVFPGVKKQVAELVKQQGGKCYHCGHYFNPDSLAEIHHIDRNHGNNKRGNLALVHGHCHDLIHANRELSTMEDWIDDHPF